MHSKPLWYFHFDFKIVSMSNHIQTGFSLDMINMHHQEPNRNRYESKYYWEELYPLIVAAGFNGVEIPFDPYWMFRGGSGVPMMKYCIEVKYLSVGNYLEHLRSQGIQKVAGIHFDPNMFMRNSSLDFYFGAAGYFASEAVKYALDLGCDYISLSPTPKYGLIKHYHPQLAHTPGWLESFLQKTAEMINRLAEIAKTGNLKIALRNEYWSLLRGNNILEFIGQLDNSLHLDADAAHIAISGQNPAEWVGSNASLIGVAHLTDTAFVDENEIWKTPNPEYPETRATQVFRDLGFGSLDLKAFCQSLEAASFDGWVILSCRQTKDPMRALLRSRSFLTNNALQLA